MNTQTLYILVVISIIILGFYCVWFLAKKVISTHKPTLLSTTNYLPIISVEDIVKRDLAQAEYKHRYLACRKMNQHFGYFTMVLLLLFVMSVIDYQSIETLGSNYASDALNPIDMIRMSR